MPACKAWHISVHNTQVAVCALRGEKCSVIFQSPRKMTEEETLFSFQQAASGMGLGPREQRLPVGLP